MILPLSFADHILGIMYARDNQSEHFFNVCMLFQNCSLTCTLIDICSINNVVRFSPYCHYLCLLWM